MKRTQNTAGEQAGSPASAPEQGLVGRKVHYVLDRPYSAGEAPEIIEARVTRVEDAAAGVVDLTFRTPAGKVTKQDRRRSDRREPGTWHEVS